MPIVLKSPPTAIQASFKSALPSVADYFHAPSGRKVIDYLPPIPVRTFTKENVATSVLDKADIAAWRYLIVGGLELATVDICQDESAELGSLKCGRWAELFQQALEVVDIEAAKDEAASLYPSVIEFPSLQTTAILVAGPSKPWVVPMSFAGELCHIARIDEELFKSQLALRAAAVSVSAAVIDGPVLKI